MLCATAGTGCVTDRIADETANSTDSIQGGKLETGYPAIGQILLGDGSFCSGTLIAPSYVLTAAHCAGSGMVFNTGTGAANFVAHPVDAQITHPTLDLLIAHLASPLHGITPMRFNWAALPAIGEVCTAVGFGWYDTNGVTTMGTKRSATEQVDSASSSQIVVQMVTGIADHGDSGGPLLCKTRIAAVVHNHTDGVWPQHTVENYTTIDPTWIANTLGHAAQFGSYQTWWNSSFYGSHGTQLGDINGDGRADLAGMGDGYVGATLSTGTSFGGYQTWWNSSFYGSRGTFLGDVDGDGRADLVGAGDGYVGVILSTGTGFGGYQTWLGTSFYGSHGTLLGDIDGDGRADLVTLDDASVSVRLSTGTGFGPPVVWWNSPFYGSHGTLIGDIDGDGRADLVGMGDGYVGAILSTGTSFGGYQTWWNNSFYGSHGTFLGDVDGDGRADLVALGDGYIGAILATP
jgi:hypothetical protein